MKEETCPQIPDTAGRKRWLIRTEDSPACIGRVEAVSSEEAVLIASERFGLPPHELLAVHFAPYKNVSEAAV